jgi:hypothetical protein
MTLVAAVFMSKGTLITVVNDTKMCAQREKKIKSETSNPTSPYYRLTD